MSPLVPIAAGAALALLIARRAGGGAPGVRYTSSFRDRVYPPFAPQTVALFREAARRARLPESWANSEGLHRTLEAESGGVVGVLNYQFEEMGYDKRNPNHQAQVFARMRDGIQRGIEPGAALRRHVGVRSSTATGLGQLVSSGVARHYPNGFDGLGDPMNEAIGMLRYIESRYGDPDTAWRFRSLPLCRPGQPRHYGRRAFDVGCKPGEGY